MTLPAYADAESDRKGSDDLAERALSTYREAGVSHARRQWVDCFDGTPTGLLDSPSDIGEHHA